MSFDLVELRDFARHEQSVLDRYADHLGPEDEILVQPPSGGGVAGGIRLCRLHGLHYEPIGGDFFVAMYFWGNFISARGQNNPELPDPIQMTEIYGRRFPIISLNHDLAKVVPAFPFATNVAGALDDAAGQADVFVIWVPMADTVTYPDGGRWELVNDLIGVCI